MQINPLNLAYQYYKKHKLLKLLSFIIEDGAQGVEKNLQGEHKSNCTSSNERSVLGEHSVANVT